MCIDGHSVCASCKSNQSDCTRCSLCRGQFWGKSVKAYIECPFCATVPREGFLLMCFNGHNMCAACKAKLGAGAKCPDCQGDFCAPPIKNIVSIKFLRMLQMEWVCKYQPDANCNFHGTLPALELHEADCQRNKRIVCPFFTCRKVISLETVMQHYGAEHQYPNEFKGARGRKKGMLTSYVPIRMLFRKHRCAHNNI